MKKNKNTANAYTYTMKNMTNSTMYTVQELYIFYNHLKCHCKSFHLHQYFHCILQLAYQLVIFYTYNLHNLNILQDHMIYHTHIDNYFGSK